MKKLIAIAFLTLCACSSNNNGLQKANQLITESNRLFDLEKPDSALIYLREAIKLYPTSDFNNPAKILFRDYNNCKSNAYAQNILTKMPDTEYKQLLNLHF